MSRSSVASPPALFCSCCPRPGMGTTAGPTHPHHHTVTRIMAPSTLAALILCSHQDDSTTHEPIITKLRHISETEHAFSNTQCVINVSTTSSRLTCQLSSWGQQFPPEAYLAVMMSFPASSSWVATPAAPPENTTYLESTSVWHEGYRPTTSRRACSLVPATGCPLPE
ncbi:hypothetical protein BGW80DRAFT_1331759, partial [Lactifluus volemus]